MPIDPHTFHNLLSKFVIRNRAAFYWNKKKKNKKQSQKISKRLIIGPSILGPIPHSNTLVVIVPQRFLAVTEPSVE